MLFFEPKSRKDLVKEPSKVTLAVFAFFGCVFIMVLVVATYSLLNIKDVKAAVGKQIVSSKIADSGLDSETQKKLNVQVDRVLTAFKDNKITEDDLKKLKAKLSNSPLAPVAAAKIIEAKYLGKSNLNKEELASGKLTFQRLVRGVYEKKISKQAVKKIAKVFFQKKKKSSSFAGLEDKDNAKGGALDYELRSDVTDYEIKNFLKQAKVLADAAKISDEPFDVDLAGELKGEIDGMMDLVNKTDKRNKKTAKIED